MIELSCSAVASWSFRAVAWSLLQEAGWLWSPAAAWSLSPVGVSWSCQEAASLSYQAVLSSLCQEGELSWSQHLVTAGWPSLCSSRRAVA